ncbi:MAG: L-serine ammonia-lyase, iron-sulfur-dependent, subunit alpha [Prevotella sp.]|nr:L-serine ammonia-lyase, iron-sulfur-dependent, subunit alpha [Prevotella sp.]
MKSLKELYKIGRGPSSSHTMGPNKAAKFFAERHPEATGFEVTLYGSLAATGKGHMTDVAIVEALSPVAPVTILWEPTIFLPFHPNGMKFKANYAKSGDARSEEWTVYSVGGGALSEGDAPHTLLLGGAKGDDLASCTSDEVYPMNTLTEILEWCNCNGRAYWEYVKECESSDIWDYLMEVWQAMKASVERGLDSEGVLPGPLNLPRKATTYYVKASGYKQSLQSRGLVYAYALAVSEENASGGTIVTAPTCGSSGVLPGVLYHLSKGHQFSDTRILHALATAGIFGNVVKQNASISGADVGCQGEVGVACAMASAAACQLFGGSPSQIEYAAEMGLEHHLGMTCDPMCGLVQIPCIERNAFAATRALDSNLYAAFSDGKHRVSFDQVVRVMKQTGHDLPSLYKETAEGGLAKI